MLLMCWLIEIPRLLGAYLLIWYKAEIILLTEASNMVSSKVRFRGFLVL